MSPVFCIPIACIVAGKVIFGGAVVDKWRETSATRADAASGLARPMVARMLMHLNMGRGLYICIGLPVFVGQSMRDRRKRYRFSHDLAQRSSVRQSTSLADVIRFALSQ